MMDAVQKGRHHHGEAHYHAKLTEIQVREIRRRFDKGERVGELAREFGICHQVMSVLVRRKTWKHVK